MNALALLLMSILTLITLSLWLHTRQKLKQFASDNQAQNKSIPKTIQNKMSALNAGSIGLGVRLIKIEKEMQSLLARMEDLQLQVQSNTPYAQAIQMIQRGDTATDIVDICNISFNEVQLLIKLHQHDQVA